MLDILRSIASDSAYKQLVQAVLRSEWKANSLRAFRQVRDLLDVREERGLSYVVKDDRIVVPDALRRRILSLAHRGHPGIVRMKQKLRTSYWWPAMDAEAESHVRHCISCQASRKSTDKADTSASIQVSVPETPWTKLALDITGPFNTAPSNLQYVVALIDYSSKYAVIHSCTDITSTSIIHWLEDVFCTFGLPQEIVTDNGRQFVSDTFESYLAERDITHLRTTPYHPQANGLVERFNRVLKEGVQAFTSDGLSWSEGLRRLLANYRGTAHGDDNKSPAARLFGGRLYRQPHQVVRRHAPAQGASARHAPARGAIHRGEEVLLRDMRSSCGKARATWLPDPYTVRHRNNKTYILVRSDGTETAERRRHRRDIKRFYRPPDFAQPQIVMYHMKRRPAPAPPLAGQNLQMRPARQRREPDRFGDVVDSGTIQTRGRKIPYSGRSMP